MTPQAREDMLREKFEQWIKQAPFEKSVTRFSADWSAWPGGYQDISVDLAWQAWKESQSSRGNDSTENAVLLAAASRMKDALFSTLKYLETRADGESNELWGKVAATLSQATGQNVE